MSDTDFRTQDRSTSRGFSDKAQKSGEDMKETASEAFNTVSDKAREKIDEFGSAAREAAADAGDKIKEGVGAQQHAGADLAHRFAKDLRSAAHAFDQNSPFAARAIETAAGYVDAAAEKVRNGSLNDLMDNVTSFARRQPAAFLGLSVLAGFAMVRFLKASGNAASSGNFRHADDSTRGGKIPRQSGQGGVHDR